MDNPQKKINLVITGLYNGEGSFGGVRNFSIFLLKNIDEKVFNTKYFSLGISPNWYHGEKKTSAFRYNLGLLLRIFTFFAFLVRHKIDVAHINTGLSQQSLVRDGVFALIAKVAGCKTVLVMHGWKGIELSKIQKQALKNKSFIFLLKSQDKIGVSSAKYKKVLENIGVNAGRIFVFSTMVDCKIYRSENKISQDPITILFAAHPIFKEKGIVEFLNAIPLINQRHPSCKIIIMGGGDNLDSFITVANNLNISNLIEFAGFVSFDKKIEIFKTSHILVFPSYSEGFPSTVLEAMASGMAIITTPVGGLEDAIKDRENGLIIRSMPPEPNEISVLVNDLLGDSRLLTSMMKTNQAEAQEKFNVKIIAGLFGSIYKEITK